MSLPGVAAPLPRLQTFLSTCATDGDLTLERSTRQDCLRRAAPVWVEVRQCPETCSQSLLRHLTGLQLQPVGNIWKLQQSVTTEQTGQGNRGLFIRPMNQPQAMFQTPQARLRAHSISKRYSTAHQHHASSRGEPASHRTNMILNHTSGD